MKRLAQIAGIILCLTILYGVVKAQTPSGAYNSPAQGSTSSGTVTNVSGTANQISVATGTSTPVISLASVLAFPGTMSAASPIAASTPLFLWNAAVTTGLTATTNRPFLYRNVTGNTDPTSWSTGDIFIGHNAAAANCSSFLEQHNNGGGINFRVDCSGGTTVTSVNSTGTVTASKLLSGTNCSASGTAANPSVVTCSTASSGAFACATAASTGTCTVNTTAASTNSNIQITPTASAGTRLSVTCNTTADTPTGPRMASISNGVSFTINLGTVATNPTCYLYTITN